MTKCLIYFEVLLHVLITMDIWTYLHFGFEKGGSTIWLIILILVDGRRQLIILAYKKKSLEYFFNIQLGFPLLNTNMKPIFSYHV